MSDAAAHRKTKTAKFGSKWVSVLVIDDDRAVHDQVRTELAALEIKTFHAFDAASGQSQAQRLLPSAIVLAWETPGATRMPVLERLKRSPETAAIPVIVLVREATREIVEQARKLGADWIVAKPLDAAVLREKMRLVTSIKGL